MLKHVIYGFFGFLAAGVIALAIYLDKPGDLVPQGSTEQGGFVESGDLEAQVAGAVATSEEGEWLPVIKVIDGDTISVQRSAGSETIRFIGINAPETGQCFTNEATERLKQLLASGKVRLELDPSQGERDKYDRLLAYVFTEGGQNAARVLIEGGFAKEYTYSKAYKYQSEFKAAQASAEAAGRGLWAPGACAASVAPTTMSSPASLPKTEPAPEVKKQVVIEEQEEDEVEEEEEKPAPKASGNYVCSTNTYNCGDFSTHAEAQAVYEACGGASNDVHKLDANKDGQACESLP